ncbi:MAG TPA: NAD(P)H-dependent oxidoreductase [Polyangiaceae bacterium]|nr:NAD(P)H-dependent oxidoreductase [Polyangiaceae bacterium]
MSKQAVFISGSPQPSSRSTRVAQAIAERLDAADLRVRRFGLSDFESSDLVYARADGRVPQHYLEVVEAASAVIWSTPVYKATYSGGLKLLLDIIPPDALRGKTVLAVASSRIGRHFQSVQRAFDDLYRFFDVGFVIPPVFVLDEQVHIGEHGLRCDANAEAAIDRAATALLSALFTPERAHVAS